LRVSQGDDAHAVSDELDENMVLQSGLANPEQSIPWGEGNSDVGQLHISSKVGLERAPLSGPISMERDSSFHWSVRESGQD